MRLRIQTLVSLVSLVVLAAALSGASADVRLPALFSNNMVVQQKMQIPVWGWAAPGEQVKVTLAARQGTATAGADGAWMVRLDPLSAGGPVDLVVAGKNTLTIKNVEVGEVYLASGQSNMEFTVKGVRNAPQEMAAARYPHIRMFTVATSVACTPQGDCVGSWQVCSPATVASFSAVGYFFAVNLQKALNVPVGIINSSWGATPIEAWTDLQSLEDDPLLKPLGDSVPAQAAACTQHTATSLYDAMIAPLVPYGIAGVIWYQGEANAQNPKLYRTQFPALIKGWRRIWGQGDFGFFFVQLPNFRPQLAEPTPGGGWGPQREAQALALALPKTGMATTIDLGEAANVHPPDKQDVGLRLALAAEKGQYGMDVIASGPTYAGMKVEGDKVRISFTDLGGGLVVKGGGPLRGFALAGANRKLVWADATVDGDTVLVSSAQVPQPTIVRYAFENNPVCNLYSQAGLPAVPFRTDAPQ